MNLPEIGDMITTERGIELCRHFGLYDLVTRIKDNPGAFKEWKFDGCSGLPDELMGLFTGCDWKDITYKCCLPHDLCYACGEPGNETERKLTDRMFRGRLIVDAGMRRWAADAFYAAVRVGGTEDFGLSFSWAFASFTK